MKLIDLPELNRSHLAWRLDAKTACGYVTACRIARLETGHANMEVWEIFKWAGQTDKSSKIHARKVMNFTLPPNVY